MKYGRRFVRYQVYDFFLTALDLIAFVFYDIQVQGKDPSVDITQDFVEESEDERFEDMSDTAPPVELPPCELNKLETINEVCSSLQQYEKNI